MRKVVLITVICAFAFVATPVMADPMVRMKYKDNNNINNYAALPGGEFTAQLQADLSGWSYDLTQLYADVTRDEIVDGTWTKSFQTFCIETGESISNDGIYDVVLNDNAVQGGVGPNGDPISQGTAFLYYQFAKGLFDPSVYNYTPGDSRKDSAKELQNTIWWLEDEGGYFSNNFRTVLDTEFGTSSQTLDLAKIEWQLDNVGNGDYSVKAMNLYASPGKQDQLVLATPIPASVILGLLGLGVVGLKLRKFA